MHTLTYQRSALETLLAETLRERNDSPTVQSILEVYPSVRDLLMASETELQQISGIGPAKARQIKAICELSRLVATPSKPKRQVIRTAYDAYMVVKDIIAYEMQEHFVCVALNTKHHVIAVKTVTVGILDASLVHPREVFRPLIQLAASGCIVAHNHPSGDSTPSNEDIAVTRRLEQAGKILGIDVLDHIVVGLDEYTSLRERGL